MTDMKHTPDSSGAGSPTPRRKRTKQPTGFEWFMTQKALQRVLLFAAIFVYWEFFLHMLIFGELNGILLGLITSLFMGIAAGLITSVFKPTVNLVLSWVILLIRFLILMVYLIYWKVFKTAFSFALVIGGSEGVNAVTQFSSMVISAIKSNVLSIIIFLIPLVLFLIFTIRHPRFKLLRPKYTVRFTFGMVILMGIFVLVLSASGDGTYDAKSLYTKQWVKDLSLRKLGFDSTVFADLKYTLFPSTVPQSDYVAYTVPEIEDPADSMYDIVSTVIEYPDLDSEEAVTMYYGDNALDIDFAALGEDETDDDYKWLDDYLANEEPTTKNQYTGMFAGYNLITITAESFSPWAVDEELTPTLYKLVNSGFVLKNYWINAFNDTSDGEYENCTGLIPNGQGNHSFQDTEGHDMAMCFGKMLGYLGYSTNAYHPHTYTFYERDLTHPNMGYTYKGYGNGLDVTYQWPESDLECMEKSVDDYINNEHFHAYYMTVSGHMEYSFNDNMMSYKHMDDVADLDCDSQMKAYIAANMELDQALEYLLERLEEAGKLDNTLIELAPDHYPYAMEELLTEEIGEDSAEWYGYYKSCAILWSNSMTESVEIDKPCTNYDMAPTICNLLGLDYDSRLYVGNDILSDAPGLVVFSDKSFITDYIMYNTVKGEYRMMVDDVELPDGYVETWQDIVDARWTASSKILTSDYYAYLKEKLGWDSLIEFDWSTSKVTSDSSGSSTAVTTSETDEDGNVIEENTTESSEE